MLASGRAAGGVGANAGVFLLERGFVMRNRIDIDPKQSRAIVQEVGERFTRIRQSTGAVIRVCALDGSIPMSTSGSIPVSAEASSCRHPKTCTRTDMRALKLRTKKKPPEDGFPNLLRPSEMLALTSDDKP